MTMDRNELTDQLERWLDYQQKGYFITLNSVVTLNDMTDQRLREQHHRFEAQVVKLMCFIKEYCFGRRYLRTQDQECMKYMKCVIGMEIGSKNGRLHAHIVAAHDGSTQRDLASVQRFIAHKWVKIINVDHEQSFTHVENMDVARDRLWYITKQSNTISRWHDGMSNISFA
jgi:hypothetical protein